MDIKESLAEGESGLIKSRTDELKKLLTTVKSHAN